MPTSIPQPGPDRQLPPTKRRTRTYLIAAVALAVLGALIVLVATSDGGGSWAYVAKDNIGARTKLNDTLFEARQIPDDYLVAGAVVADSEEELAKQAAFDEGKYAADNLDAGEQLTTADLNGLKLSEPLGQDERLMSISVDYADAAAGAVRVGDKVDVYGVGGSIGVSQLLISGVEVVAVTVSSDQLSTLAQRQLDDAKDGKQTTVDEIAPTDPIPGIYTIRVPNTVVGRIAIVDEDAKLMLVARGSDAAAGATQGWDIQTALCSGPYLSTGDPTLPEACQR